MKKAKVVALPTWLASLVVLSLVSTKTVEAKTLSNLLLAIEYQGFRDYYLSSYPAALTEEDLKILIEEHSLSNLSFPKFPPSEKYKVGSFLVDYPFRDIASFCHEAGYLFYYTIGAIQGKKRVTLEWKWHLGGSYSFLDSIIPLERKQRFSPFEETNPIILRITSVYRIRPPNFI